MSQEKVAKYKEAKANRKQTMKKEKRARLIRNIVTGVVCGVRSSEQHEIYGGGGRGKPGAVRAM